LKYSKVLVELRYVIIPAVGEVRAADLAVELVKTIII
jgi:hypothetical protein